MRYEITYAQNWIQKCPTCSEQVVLHRPCDEPHKELYGTCENCEGEIAGFIHPASSGIFHPFVIDLNVGKR